jgi:hypothetical protein
MEVKNKDPSKLEIGGGGIVTANQQRANSVAFSNQR